MPDQPDPLRESCQTTYLGGAARIIYRIFSAGVAWLRHIAGTSAVSEGVQKSRRVLDGAAFTSAFAREDSWAEIAHVLFRPIQAFSLRDDGGAALRQRMTDQKTAV